MMIMQYTLSRDIYIYYKCQSTMFAKSGIRIQDTT